jgi:phage/plasmid-like protein (TIGR03299 family)
MAHQINYNEQTQKHSFFSVKEKAWHGLGQIVEDYPTSVEALKFAGLDFEVSKSPNLHRLPNGDELLSDNSFFTFRTDNNQVLGDKLGSDYQVVQNEDAFLFFDAIVNHQEGILYETAGALGKGERIFITAKLPDFIRVGYDDLIEKYLFLTTSHDGSGSITAAFTPIRIVCNNTLNAALRNQSNCLKIKHTNNAKERLQQAHQLMGISNLYAKELEEVFNVWTKIRITDKEVLKLVQQVMAPTKEVLENVLHNREDENSTHFKNICNDILEYAFSSHTQQTNTTKGTLFGAYNAITGYYQNVKSYKNGEQKLNSIQFGTGLQRSQKAFDLCLKVAKNKQELLFN